MPGKFKFVLVLLLATLLATVLISPAVNLEPTTMHAWSATRNLAAPLCAVVSTTLMSVLPGTRVLFLPAAATVSSRTADLVALNCTRLC